MDSDITAEKLGKYKVLILAASCCMSKEQADEVRKYVSAGGTLVASWHSSLYNEYGLDGSNFQLADVMGVDYEKLIKGPLYIKRGSDTVPYPLPALKVKLNNSTAGVLAELLDRDKKPVSPAMVLNKYGKGKSFYLAAGLGQPNYELESSSGKKWTFEKNKELYDLLIDVVKKAEDDSFRLKEVNIPEKVLVTVYEQDYKGKKNVLVHLLNATGVNMKKDDIVPGRDPERNAFPALKQDLVFDLKPGRRIQSGYIVSPDYEDKREIKIEPQSDGYYRITVPAKDLKTYSIVYLEI